MFRTTVIGSAIGLVALLATHNAAAQTASASGSASASADTSGASVATTDEKKPGSFVVGGEIGAMFPQPFTELGTHLRAGIELGYRLPFAEQRVEIMGDVGYAPPGNSFDLKRAEGTYEGRVRSQQLHFSLGPRIHVLPGTSKWNVTVAAGPRLFLLKSTSSGSRNGQEFMKYTETSTQFGFFVALGGEYLLGPGAVFLDLDLGWAKMPHRITGDVSTGNIAATLGYRFFL
jgi:hypothetical protein